MQTQDPEKNLVWSAGLWRSVVVTRAVCEYDKIRQAYQLVGLLCRIRDCGIGISGYIVIVLLKWAWPSRCTSRSGFEDVHSKVCFCDHIALCHLPQSDMKSFLDAQSCLNNLFAAQARLVKGRKPPHVRNRKAGTRLALTSKSEGNTPGEGLKMLVELNIYYINLHYNYYMICTVPLNFIYRFT